VFETGEEEGWWGEFGCFCVGVVFVSGGEGERFDFFGFFVREGVGSFFVYSVLLKEGGGGGGGVEWGGGGVFWR